jgi:hypothetical protein
MPGRGVWNERRQARKVNCAKFGDVDEIGHPENKPEALARVN